MDIFEDLELLLSTSYLSYYEIHPKSNSSDEKLFVTFHGTNITGNHVKRDVVIREGLAKDLYDLLFMGYLIKRYDENDDLQFLVSQTNDDIFEFAIDGKRLSKKELQSLFEEATRKFSEEYTKIEEEVRSLEFTLKQLISQFRMEKFNAEKKKHALKAALESTKRRVKLQDLSAGYDIQTANYGDVQALDIGEIIQATKRDNSINVAETGIISAINKVIKEGKKIDLPLITPYYDFRKFNDKLILLELLKTLKQGLETAIEKSKEAVYEIREEIEQIYRALDEVRRSAFLGNISKEKLGEIFSEIDLQPDTEKEIPELDISDKAKKFGKSRYIGTAIDSFEYKKAKSKAEIDRLDDKINNSMSLSYDEKFAINLYKSQLYRAFNNVIRYLKMTGQNLDQIVVNDDVLAIIKKSYDELYKMRSSEPGSLAEMFIPNRDLVVDHYFDQNFRMGIPTFEEYKDLVIKYYSPLMSAFTKVTLDEDITVYRGVSGGDLDLSGIISTTLDPKVTLQFRDRIPDSKVKTFIRIKLPKGSPVIAFTNNLLRRTRKEYDDNLLESQKEIAFNSELFDVVSYEQKSEFVREEDDPTWHEVRYFDVVLRPKTLVYENEESGPERS